MLLAYSLMKALWFIGITNGHHKAIVVILMVILMRAHCFHDYIYIYMHIYIFYIYMMYNNIHDGYTYTKTCKEQ